MTPGAQVAAAIDILGAVEAGPRPADDAAADYFRRRRYIGAKDRAAIAGHVYAVLRQRAALDWWLGRAGGGAVPAARGRVIAALALIEGWTQERIRACCDGDRFRPAPLAPAEERLLRSLAGHTLEHPQMPRAVRNALPEWLEPHLAQVFGVRFEPEMAALNRPAPTDLRVNLLKGDRDGARKALAAAGMAAEPTPWSPLGLRLAGRAPLSALAAFKEGLVEVQDEGSQLAALLAGVRPHMRVVDFCAGAGGKTLALAAQMRNRGTLVACDVSARRLERAAQRLRRAGVSNVERRALSGERDKWVKRHARSFDRVFLDVPCLGTGTWRRNPDAKWRSGPQDLAELVERQQEILRSAARLVKPGGRLVYATCSFLVQEDEAQAEAFLAAEPDFSLYPAERAWAEAIGGVAPGIGRFARLSPARHGTDGFFVAIFERKPEPAKSPHLTPALSALRGEREGIRRVSDGEGEVGEPAAGGDP
ncbi:MAG TPA: RsmB/NOP family class I SAM-dependent RNA methyltransferase [Stellaceae bacterium]|nr:RsmB/NOP family class I SAM-dependent RNA methyltransferase [Stellaceae bacterium]